MKSLGRRDFMKAAGFGGATLAFSLMPTDIAQGVAENPANVIIIITDDQGYGDLACHGNPWIKTPNLDSLHSNSVRLTDFHVSPICSPTRAALMTGRHCRHMGVNYANNYLNLLSREVPTMADIFALNGYRTGIFGKWHLGVHYPYRACDRGFQESVVHGDGAITTTGDIWGNDYFDDTYWHNGKKEKYQGYCTDVWFRQAMRFMKKDSNRPFLCYIPTNAAHGPYIVEDKYKEPYMSSKDIPNPAFYGMITNIDKNVGHLLEFLKTTGLEQNTILIFMTDNGTCGNITNGQGFVTKGYNAGMRGGKGSPYEGGSRVPCFIRWPAKNLTGGRDIHRLAAHIDILPTLIDLCRLKRPEGVVFDGVSIRPLLEGRLEIWSDRVVVESFTGTVMTDRWRLVKEKELYDIRKDPSQREDVALHYPDVAARLLTELKKNRSMNDNKRRRYIIGSSKQDLMEFTPEHWWGVHLGWKKDFVLQGKNYNGPLLLEVAKEGIYEFSLRRWPVEINRPIRAADGNGKALDIVKARLEIGAFDKIADVSGDMNVVTFRVHLKPGDIDAQTWFIRGDDTSSGAYFVYVGIL